MRRNAAQLIALGAAATLVTANFAHGAEGSPKSNSGYIDISRVGSRDTLARRKAFRQFSARRLYFDPLLKNPSCNSILEVKIGGKREQSKLRKTQLQRRLGDHPKIK